MANIAEVRKMSAEERIKRGCVIDGGRWLWQRSTDSIGYPHMRFRGRTVKVHRLVYETFVGPIPDGLHIMHIDDDKRNCAPANLRLGTQQDNMDDRDRKGRHGSIKLTSEQIRDILDGPGTQREKALRNGCSQASVSMVMNDKRKYIRLGVR